MFIFTTFTHFFQINRDNQPIKTDYLYLKWITTFYFNRLLTESR